uniref:DUF3421 domain-containing protein n=1 Tax=Syphacia muris TaxID=451379 RepID=A0A0N5AAE3_9BILA
MDTYVEAATAQSHYVDFRYLKRVKQGDTIPVNAVRPFGRSLFENGRKIDYVVAKWIPNDKQAVWGKAWLNNGSLNAVFVHNNIVKNITHPEIANGFYILIYNGSVEENGFRFSWELSRDVDTGTVLYSGFNKHVPAVYSDPYSNSECLGESIWDQRIGEFVLNGRDVPIVINNLSNLFDQRIYVLTKQRCNCQC